MNFREAVSPLNEQPELWDAKPDMQLSQDSLVDVCRVLSDTAILLGEPVQHPGGSVSEYVEHIAGIRFSGWILQRPPACSTDIALTIGQSLHTVQAYTLSSIEYAEGAKVALGDEGVRTQPLLREQFVFLDMRTDRRIEWLSRLSYNNMPMPDVEPRLDELQMEMMRNARVDIDRFSIYSLYKINKLLDCLRTDSRLA